jgi:hypothetical protein
MEQQYRDAVISSDQMVIVKKFDQLTNYIYPIVQNAPKKHGVLRNKLLDALFEQVELFMKAGKSGQKSRLYACDAGLAYIRYLMRFATHNDRRIMSLRQHEIALIKISEVGAMLNAWIRKTK